MSDLRESLTQTGTLIGYINTIVYAHNYNDLTNKPQINGVTLSGNKTASDLGLVTPQTEAVTSVNSKTGAVVLDGTDIQYDSSNTINQQIDAVAASIDYPVTSVNSKTGDVVLDGSDINYDGTYNVNQKIAAVESEIPVVNYPVTSVNTKTGDVVLDGTDINYDASNTINQKIDAVAASIPVVDYPVTSVAGKTGAVELYASDIICPDTSSGSIATFTTSLEKPLVACEVDQNANKLIHTSGNDNTLNECIRGVFQGTYGFVDLGTLDWDLVSGYTHLFHGPYSTGGQKANSTNGCCYGYSIIYTSYANIPNMNIRIEASGITLRNDSISDGVSLKTALNGVYLVYELDTPTTPSITQAQFDTLCGSLEINGDFYELPVTPLPTTYSGINNFFTDYNASVDITYLESIKDYIDKRVNP